MKRLVHQSVARAANHSFSYRNITLKRRIQDSLAQQRHSTVACHRFLSSRASDQLMGYNPMAPATPTAGANKKSGIPTEEDVTTMGGVWAPTSAKRDKIGELKIELNFQEGEYSLDDVAKPQQKLDLYLADGLYSILSHVDSMEQMKEDTVEEHQSLLSRTAMDWLENAHSQLPPKLNQTQWETHLTSVIARMDHIIQQQQGRDNDSQDAQQKDLSPIPYLKSIRNLMTPIPKANTVHQEVEMFQEFATSQQDETSQDDTHDHDVSSSRYKLDDITTTTTTKLQGDHASCVDLYRILLLKAAAQHLKSSWSVLTTVSSANVDRAAVMTSQGKNSARTLEELQQEKQQLSSRDLYRVLMAFVSQSCNERVTALWKLVHNSGGGIYNDTVQDESNNVFLLDEEEMNHVCNLSVVPVGMSLQELLQLAIQARPVDMQLGDEEEEEESNNKEDKKKKKPGFFVRRRQRNIVKQLTRLLDRATKSHFEDEVEMPHRLRCIYAWADKAHQENQVESVHVQDTTALSGRKRYVELAPKIALNEFREVQRIHFGHLDRVGQEMIKSFRENLWVHQGRGRQRAELQRNTLYFLGLVSLIDYGIYFL